MGFKLPLKYKHLPLKFVTNHLKL